VETNASLIGLPDQKTLYAMRLLTATPHSGLCAKLTHALYKAYWKDGANVESIEVLQRIANDIDWAVDVAKIITSEQVKSALQENTHEAVTKGAFGVPSLLAQDKLFFGVDRMFLAERYLGNKDAHPPRHALTPVPKKSLKFYFDYSSPYSYLGAVRLEQICRRYPMVEVQFVPMLLGALLTAIGTPVPPASRWPDAKRKYYIRDLFDWAEYIGVTIRFNSAFPINCLLALRVTIAAGLDIRVIRAIYEAIWRDDKDISKESVLLEILQHLGLNGHELIEAAKTNEIKQVLKANTNSALESGLCGLPTFQVDEGPLIWGQDRLNIVEDMLCGWQDLPHQQSML
jgi:2-hydroxychromene-2-carboxylate isomerase